MRIFHVIVGLNVGGSELMLYRLITQQQKTHSDVEHHVISLTTMGTVGARLQANGIAVTALGMISILQAPTVLWRLAHLLRDSQPNIVQTWMYHADLLGGLAARLAGNQPVIWGIRTTDIKKGSARTTVLVRWLCARLSNWIPHTIVCAAKMSERLHIALGYRADRITVIPNGFDLSRLQTSVTEVAALRKACGLEPDAMVLGTLGRFNVVKDQQNFVRAAGLLAHRHPAARFLMVGRDCDANNKELAGWIATTGAIDQFILLGEREDVPACLAAMDVFALPSRTEGFPNVLAEAMAMGRPCVTTDVGDAAVVLGDCGEVVPREDSGALAQAMERFITMATDQRIAMGAAGRERVAQEYSMMRCADRFAQLYIDVLKTPRK